MAKNDDVNSINFPIKLNLPEANVNSKGGVKNDKLKPMCYLLREFSATILSWAKVLTYGAKQYSPNNWKFVEREQYESAMWRHWLAYQAGERFDPDTGESHLSHMMCNIGFLDWFDRQTDKKT